MLNQHNTSVSRVSRDGTKAILKSGGRFYVYSTETKTLSAPFGEFGALVAGGQWRRPLSDENGLFVPVDSPVVSEEEAADALFEGEKEEPHAFIEDEVEGDEYDFNDEYDFFAVPNTENPDEVTAVYALDPADEATLYLWKGGEFIDVSEEEFESSDMAQWILVDADSATSYAKWIDSHGDGEFAPLYDDPTEKAMFEAATGEIDWDFIDTLSAVIADASGYSPVERSRNAQKQRRGPGGRFARTPGKGGAQQKEDETSAPEVLKTYIPAKREITLLPNPLNFIVEFIGSASPSSGPSVGGGVGVAAAGTPEQIVGDEAQKETREQTVESPDTIYFAIVTKDDQRAVQSLIAITKAEDGKPQAWNRNMGEWKLSPEALADLQSITPPPVVQLDEETVKEVMAGVDKFDQENGGKEVNAPVDRRKNQLSIQDDIRRGFALVDGSYCIKNEKGLFFAVQTAPEDASFEVKSHIVKRARALNRMDVVPQEWRDLSVFTQTPLYTSYGEVITAAGNRGGNEETLKQYWMNGKGAAKIRWGNNEGDLTRCHRKLTKYLGSERAWGYCQNLHMRKYGKSNYKRDNG